MNEEAERKVKKMEEPVLFDENKRKKRAGQTLIVLCVCVVVLIFLVLFFLHNKLQKDGIVTDTSTVLADKMLPLGTIVYAKEGEVKIMIIGRGVTLDNGAEGDIFTDYVGVIYPKGLDPKDAIFFNHEDIDRIVFKGYSDEEEERFLKIYEDWQKKRKIA